MDRRIKTKGEKIFQVFNILIMLLSSFIMIYPIWHVLCASFSDAKLLLKHKGALFLPKGFSTAAYIQVSKNPMILKSYANTIFIVVFGVTVNIVLTSMTAYVLSRKNVYFKKLLTVLIIVTMYVSGGTIPFYFLVKGIGLENSLWSVILPTAINSRQHGGIGTAGRRRTYADSVFHHLAAGKGNRGGCSALLCGRALEFMVQCGSFSERQRKISSAAYTS